MFRSYPVSLEMLTKEVAWGYTDAFGVRKHDNDNPRGFG